MSNIRVKNVPRLKLGDLLRRRKMSLKTFMDEFGVTTYEALTFRCKRLGVQEPEESEFNALNMPLVSDPSEGVIVLSAPLEASEPHRSRNELVHVPTPEVLELPEQEPVPLEGTQKKSKKKKEDLPADE